MNRKQIVNENLRWPEIDEAISEKILNALEIHLKKYPELKRTKNPPKKYRKKKQKLQHQQQEEQKSNTQECTTASHEVIKPLKEVSIKSYIRIGINSITKTLEREPANVMFVLVCRSCKPLTILTRHIQVMCAIENIAAGCVHNLSTRLNSIINIKTLSAILILKATAANDSDQAITRVLNEWQSQVSPLMPRLKNPFIETEWSTEAKKISASLLDEVSRELKTSRNDNNDDVKMIDSNDDEREAAANAFARDEEDEEDDENEFGDDFVRFRSNNDVKYLSMGDDDSTDFINFNDAYQRKRKRLTQMEF